ncbi:hypothetical protein THIX_60483 [Thiomonas sp. X19]|uniref:hypothetical protein n=1 Tax=Thiomonas sp. X19 TaxID=1050370 RepID=UPI000B6A9A4D|nr:hypothetical protein [Thiomonas sp. X19]SCC94425.1 hypothetical protein THIX_60483 [Thiomonas sp. X19]
MIKSYFLWAAAYARANRNHQGVIPIWMEVYLIFPAIIVGFAVVCGALVFNMFEQSFVQGVAALILVSFFAGLIVLFLKIKRKLHSWLNKTPDSGPGEHIRGAQIHDLRDE